MLSMAAFGALAFAILFKAGPSDDAAVKTEKMRQHLTKLAEKEERKRKEEQKKKAEKLEKKVKPKASEKKKKGKGAEEEEAEHEEEDTKEIYVPNVPIHNDTPTTKVRKLDARSRSPAKEEKHEKKEKEPAVPMPTKKEIERDLSQGFVVVQKKGPPPLTAEQKQEREALRKKEEEEEKRKESEEYKREKEQKDRRLKQALEGGIAEGASQELVMQKVKEKLEKEKAERQQKQSEKFKVGGVVKVSNLNRVQQDSEEAEIRGWNAASARDVDEVGEAPAYDDGDYPSL